MPQFKDAPVEMNKIMESAYSSALKKYKGNKAKASKIAIGAAENAGWSKGKDGKWMKKQKEMAEDIEIDAFKEGVYPQGTFAQKELSEIASSYNPEVYEAPILIGHLSDPSYKGKSSIPAYGWISGVKIVGDHLKLVASQFSEQLKEFIQQGFYKKVSAAFFQPDDPNNPTPGKWHLHHLAFLGGTPPAVKGLEGIAFAEFPSLGIEFAETDAVITGIDAVEEMGTEDTIKDLTESCATFISKIQDALTNDIDYETQKERCQLAAIDLTIEINDTLNMQWMFQEKLENIEEHQESEMAEKKSIKQVLVEMAQSFINKRKENKVDAKKEEEYQAKISEQDTQLKEFAEKERLANEKKLADETAAAEIALKADVTTFCETAIKEGRMTPAMRVKDEPIMFDLSKTNKAALKSFQEKYVLSVVPLGTVIIENQSNDKRSQVMKDAEEYAVAHAKEKEFAGLDKDTATARAFYLYRNGQIKFESNTNTKGAK